jgi:histone H3/H4
MKMEFSIRSMRQIFKSNTGKRVSEDAAEELGEFMDEWAQEIGQQAVKIAEEDARSTVRAEDIREVLRSRKDRDVEQKLNI